MIYFKVKELVVLLSLYAAFIILMKLIPNHEITTNKLDDIVDDDEGAEVKQIMSISQQMIKIATQTQIL